MKKRTAKKEGVKYDTGKADVSLIPFEVLEECAEVLMHGARIYGRYNWQNGLEYTRLSAACDRHHKKFMDKHQTLDLEEDCKGCKQPKCDKHSKRHHLAAAIVNLMFMLSYELNGQKHLDNRRPKFKK